MNTSRIFHNPDTFLGQLLLSTRAYGQALPYVFGSFASVRACLRFIPAYTMVNLPVLIRYQQLAKTIAEKNIPGALVECGVWNGGAAALMAKTLMDHGEARDCWLFDSFEGLPAPSEKDGKVMNRIYFPHWCTGNPEKVKQAFDRIHYPPEKVYIRKGWFDQTFPAADISPIALLHIDADLYEPVKMSLERWYDLVSPGGYIILNDYDQWEGCNLAVRDFFKDRNLDPEIQKIAGTGAVIEKDWGIEGLGD